jgi:hypothetical protein
MTALVAIGLSEGEATPAGTVGCVAEALLWPGFTWDGEGSDPAPELQPTTHAIT